MTSDSAVGRLIALLALAVFSGTLVTRLTDPLVAVLARDLGSTTARAALLASAFALPFALIQPILGPVGDALGKRRVMTVAVGLLTILLVASALAPDLDSLMALRALSGLAAGGLMPLAIALVGDAASMHNRQVALSRLVACAITGQIAGGSFSGLLEPFLGWRGVMLAASGVAAMGLAILVVGGRSLPAETRRRFEPVRAALGYVQLMRLPAARILYVSVAVEGGFVFGSFPYFALTLQDRGIGATAEAGLAIAAFGIGGLIYAAIARRVLGMMGQNRMVFLGGGLCLLSYVGFGFAPAAWVFIGAGLVLGVGMYMIHNSIQTRVTEVAPHARGTAVALHAFHFFLGQTIGPVVFGLILRQAGPRWAFLIGGISLLVLALLLGRRGAGRTAIAE
ncbi:MAG: MFS transporter [Acetobacteraceae bacterium]